MKTKTLLETIKEIGRSEDKKHMLDSDTYVLIATKGKDRLGVTSATPDEYGALISGDVKKNLEYMAEKNEDIASATILAIADCIVEDLDEAISEDSVAKKTLVYNIHTMSNEAKTSTSFAIITDNDCRARISFEDLTAGYFSIVDDMIKSGKLSKADVTETIIHCISQL